MRATESLTAEYHAAHPGLYSSLLGRTGLRVSGAGFGGYRMSVGVEAHHMGLRRALTGGINLIDTSANYADGGSEELIGETIDELERAGSISRGQIVVVSKGGY
ncbi:MAG: aldo/keto reductase, partial [Bacteroidota bacterium]